MAGSNSFGSLSRLSKKGAAPTLGTQSLEEEVPAMSIGAVVDTAPPALPFPKRSPFSALSRGTIAEEAEFKGHVYDTPKSEPAPAASADPFGALIRTPVEEVAAANQSRNARKDIQAIKVVTRLVQGVSFHPGSRADNAVKSNALREQLVLAHRLGSDMARHVGAGKDNGTWVMAQCCEVAADIIAKRSETAAPQSISSEVEAQVQVTNTVFDKLSADPELQACVDALGENQYVPATDGSIVRDRIAVSLSSAVWDLHERVRQYEFDYGFTEAEIVEMLVEPILKMALEASISIASLDMKVSHLQGTLRRLSGLIGAEYGARTQKVLCWIDEGVDVGDATRGKIAHDKFVSEILPEIHLLARKNFQSIEKIAPRMFEDAGSRLDLQQTHDRTRDTAHAGQ